jgi:hypothetical protein
MPYAFRSPRCRPSSPTRRGVIHAVSFVCDTPNLTSPPERVLCMSQHGRRLRLALTKGACRLLLAKALGDEPTNALTRVLVHLLSEQARLPGVEAACLGVSFPVKDLLTAVAALAAARKASIMTLRWATSSGSAAATVP